MSTNNNILISVVIPCYNEEQRIKPTLESIIQFFGSKNISYEIIIVNDGSNDNTVEFISHNFKDIQIVNNDKNFGKGFSIKQGIFKSKGEYCLVIDADNSTSIECLEEFLNYLNGYDILIGSRFLKSSIILGKQPIVRTILSKAWHRVFRNIFVKGIQDTQCGFKLFKADKAKILFENLVTKRFGYDVEILAKAQQKGFSILEIPVKWKDVQGSKFNTFVDGLRTFFELILIKYKF